MGRTGEKFMKLAKSGEIQNMCEPNAMLTLMEYVLDYGDAETCKKAEKVIKERTEKLKSCPPFRDSFLLCLKPFLCNYFFVYMHLLVNLSYIIHSSSKQGRKSVKVTSLSAILLTPTGTV